MERISTIQTASVITQPTDAVERPLTLIEKLEQEVKRLLELKAQEKPHSLGYVFLGHHIAATVNAINIVKQHQSWRKMPSDEKPRDMQAYNLLLKNDSSEYPTLYSVGLFRQYASGHVWLSLVEAETYIDESKILAWQPMNMPSDEFFESLKQPPREPQYLISKGGYWYRPNAKGYTASKHEAGRFSKEFAERHAKEVREVRIFEDKENG